MPHHDADLAALLPEITGPSGQFRHRQHIHLAFLAVRRYGMPEATTRISRWIRGIAAYERAPQKYHHTVSRAWVEIVAHHVGDDPDCADFGTFADKHPALLDKRLLARHYRSSTLAAAPARSGWVEPDLLPFPWSPGQDILPLANGQDILPLANRPRPGGSFPKTRLRPRQHHQHHGPGAPGQPGGEETPIQRVLTQCRLALF